MGVLTLGSLSGNSLFSGSESQCSVPQTSRLESSMKLTDQFQSQEHLTPPDLSDPAQDPWGSPVLSGQVMRGTGEGTDGF